MIEENATFSSIIQIDILLFEMCKDIFVLPWAISSGLNIGDPHVSLTHWGRVTHICVSQLAIIGLDNGLLPDWCQAIIWTNVGLLLIGPLGTNFREILIETYTFSLKKLHLKMSGKCLENTGHEFCLSLNVLTCNPLVIPYSVRGRALASIWCSVITDRFYV